MPLVNDSGIAPVRGGIAGLVQSDYRIIDMKYSREEAHRRLYALAVKFLNKHDPCGECPIKDSTKR